MKALPQEGVVHSAAMRKPGKAGLAAVYAVFVAIVIRTFTSPHVGPLLPRYLALETVFLVLFTAAWWRPRSHVWIPHVYLAMQSLIAVLLVSFNAEFDFAALFFFLLSYQAAIFVAGRRVWVWVGAFVVLTGGSLAYYLGFFDGLARSLTTIAGEVVVAAYIVVNRETEAANTESQALLKELDTTNAQLKEYAGKVEDLAAGQERDRLATSLRDSVSQTLFSMSLTVRSAQLLLDRDASRVPLELARLQSMTTEALGNLRSLIGHLRAS